MREIKKIAVTDFGVMGRQIAQLCAQYGFNVTAKDLNNDILKFGLEEIRKKADLGLKQLLKR